MKKLFYLFMISVLVLGLFVSCKDSESTVIDTPGLGEGEMEIKGIVVDAIELNALAGIEVELAKMAGTRNYQYLKTATTNELGIFLFDQLHSGTYKLTVTIPNYKPATAENIVLNVGQGGLAMLNLFPIDEAVVNPFASLSGIVKNSNHQKIAGATISVSSDVIEQTNGYFTSIVSLADGSFAIPAIPLVDFNGDPIESFRIRVMAPGYQIRVISGIVLTENNTSYMDVVMQAGTATGNVIFADDFETDKYWEATGFWHRQANASIKNDAYPQFVKLAPDDFSGANIPNAVQGTYTYWYGDPETGNFLGDYDTEQDSLSGGTSNESNTGNLSSPIIDLVGKQNASITFWTYWEVESVNPNMYGFDIMEITVMEIDNNGYPVDYYPEVLTRLNPNVDPILEDREAIPYTSGGFNRAPVWVYHSFDITKYTGKRIVIGFNFRTVDSLYNGFRGWFIDDFKVLDVAGEIVPEIDDEGDYRAVVPSRR